MKTSILLAALSSVSLASLAGAVIVGDPLTVTVSGATSSFVVHYNPADFDPGTGEYSYSLTTPVVFENTNGQQIGRLTGLTLYGVTDPLMSMGFSFEAFGPFSPTISIVTGVNTFAPITNPSAYSHAEFTLTDSSTPHNSATMTGNFGGFGFHSIYNGGPVFASNGASYGVGFGGSQHSTPDDVSGVIPGSVSSIQTAIDVTISAGDSVSATTNFVVVPGPGALGLLGLSGLTLARRRRA